MQERNLKVIEVYCLSFLFCYGAYFYREEVER